MYNYNDTCSAPVQYVLQRNFVNQFCPAGPTLANIWRPFHRRLLFALLVSIGISDRQAGGTPRNAASDHKLSRFDPQNHAPQDDEPVLVPLGVCACTTT